MTDEEKVQALDEIIEYKDNSSSDLLKFVHRALLHMALGKHMPPIKGGLVKAFLRAYTQFTEQDYAYEPRKYGVIRQILYAFAYKLLDKIEIDMSCMICDYDDEVSLNKAIEDLESDDGYTLDYEDTHKPCRIANKWAFRVAELTESFAVDIIL